MKVVRQVLLVCLVQVSAIIVFGQQPVQESLAYNTKWGKTVSVSKDSAIRTKCTITPFIAPSILISYGVLALNSRRLREVDIDIKNRIIDNSPNFRSKVDDYLQYVSAAAVYALNATGIKGKNNFADRTIMYGMTTVLTGAAVTGIKHWANVTRPDGSASNSFPSGHTTTAFAAAEFLHQEYGHRSVWYSIAGYTCATATGVLRTFNRRHFFSDVVCGAGLGILSTKLVYKIYPAIKRKFHKGANPPVLI